MITKVSLKNIATYGETPAVLETDKTVNLIYGLNGTGKTTFSNYLANKNNYQFCHCSIEGLNNEKVLVYNHQFIEDNFLEKNIQKGIFTLSSENKEAEEKIKEAKEKIKRLNLQLKDEETKTGLIEELNKNEQEAEDLDNNTREKTWEIEKQYSGGDRVLDFCLEGKKSSKKILFHHLSQIPKPSEQPKQTIEYLKKESEATQGEKVNIYDENEIQTITFAFSSIEENTIFQEVIIGNNNSQIANLIKKLENSDWVKQGLDYIKQPDGQKEICPFCQKNTISKELYKEIQDYFDETYIKRVSELKDLTNNYFREYQSIKDKEIDFLNNPFIKNKENDFKVIYKALLEKLGNNWSKMNNKTKSTSQIIMLESSDKEKEELNKFLQTITEEIKTHNIKIKNKDDTRKELIETFWQIMRWEYDQTIDNYNTQKEKIRREKGGINEKINKTREEISEQEKIIQQAQKEIINIDEAIGNINRELKFLGAEGFEIVKNDNVSYKIQREEQQGANFKTLSEGEKTIISFLYFLELCKGKSEENEVIMEKIIVIDDPISSLSHMYVFNIAQLIKHNFLGDEYKQVFILTHSLYFFHELLNLIKHMYKGKNTKWKLFRFLKIQNKSYIEKMEEKEIQNDYQAYWQVLKDHEQQKSSNALLANAMRNILDHFFGFIQRDDLGEAMKKINKERQYDFFIRYMQRESHSSTNTISDMKDIDPEIFKAAFKKIFIESKYRDHYNRMMNLDDN